MENKDYLTLEVKRKINVTWDDEETNQAIDSMVEDAIITLNEKLGANIDYSKPGMERNLFKNYCLYAWKDCLDDFDKKYINEIYQIRAKYEVESYVEKKYKSI